MAVSVASSVSSALPGISQNRCSFTCPVRRANSLPQSTSRAGQHPLGDCSRDNTQYQASTSDAASSTSKQALGVGWQPGRARRGVVVQALFDPPPFTPDKLTVCLAPGTTAQEPAPPHSRKYTLTHNDITAALMLTIGSDYNHLQTSGFYTQLLRDEVRAEWKTIGGSSQLHIYVHVSGEERWLAPPHLRNYIFRRELPLVLDSILYADRALLQSHPHLKQAEVLVHFQSSIKELDTTDSWGSLGDRSSWPEVPTSILLRVIFAVIGWPSWLRPQPAAFTITPVTWQKDMLMTVEAEQTTVEADDELLGDGQLLTDVAVAMMQPSTPAAAAQPSLAPSLAVVEVLPVGSSTAAATAGGPQMAFMPTASLRLIEGLHKDALSEELNALLPSDKEPSVPRRMHAELVPIRSRVRK